MTDPLNRPGHLSQDLVEQCTSNESVSSLLAQDPSLSPSQAWKRLYGGNKKHSVRCKKDSKGSKEEASPSPEDAQAAALDELELAAKCGKWGPRRPSDLFLKIYHDALCTIDRHFEYAMVSPSLMGSCGVVPLTIISVIPDIVRHMSNVIVRAEKEVILATNYWQDSVASKFLTNAIRELDRRAGVRGDRVAVRILYDRGSPRQLFEPHYLVPEKEYTGDNVRLPHPDELPNTDMQVMNYHTPLVGTFHSKYMVVDRKIALLQSNNVQDNANLEMLIHLEGPIVDSMYDMALLSWHKKMDPPLPSYNRPAAGRAVTCFGGRHSEMFDADGRLRGSEVVVDPAKIKTPMDNPHGDQNGGSKPPGVVQGNGSVLPADGTSWKMVNGATHARRSHPSPAEGDYGNSSGARHMDGQLPNGRVDKHQEDSQKLGEQVLPEHSADDPHYDNDIAGEIARIQAQISPKPGETHMQAVTRLLNHTVSQDFPGTAPECPPAEEMTPYIPHPAHDLIPMALVNRSPYGLPTHSTMSNPQNAAWLSALKNATRTVFIQSPTLNAEPLIPAIREACERGVDVYCYICIGYNDAGELLPHQGGHNEMVAHKLYQSLSAFGRQRLHYYWYVAKDQTRPIHKSYADKRNSHIKLMIVDEHIGIVGNGNQDTQSWFHSQEINLMLDSHEICKAWMDALRRNQNTHLYGALDPEEGVWRDDEGREVEGCIGVDPGKFSWLKGAVGAIKRVRGTGGF